MEPQIVDQVKLAGSMPAHDLSAFGLFMQADIVVKLVMLLLVAASVWTWAIIFQKSMKLKRLKDKAVYFEDRFWAGGSLDALYEKIGNHITDPMTAVFAAAMHELKSAAEKNLLATAAMRANLLQRIDRVVAPGIAEALFATAIGLVAAIPAVLAYNKFNSEISKYAERLDFFGSDLISTISRNLEE